MIQEASREAWVQQGLGGLGLHHAPPGVDALWSCELLQAGRYRPRRLLSRSTMAAIGRWWCNAESHGLPAPAHSPPPLPFRPEDTGRIETNNVLNFWFRCFHAFLTFLSFGRGGASWQSGRKRQGGGCWRENLPQIVASRCCPEAVLR